MSELYDEGAERNAAYCDLCGIYHSGGTCSMAGWPPVPATDEDAAFIFGA